MSIAEGLSGIFEDPSLTNRANTWSQPQTFNHALSTLDVANSFRINAAFGNTVINAHAGIDLNGISPDIIGIYSDGLPSQVLVMDKNQDLAIGGNFISMKNGTRINWGIPPASSTPAMASATVYQNTTYSYQTIDIPVYASTSGTAGSVAVAYGPSSTPATNYTQEVPGSTSSTSVAVVHLRVPPHWYYSLTTTGATIGTVTQVQE